MSNNSPSESNWLHSSSSYISQRQLAFINSIINMQHGDLPKQILEVGSHTLMRRESLLPGKTVLINSASPPSNSYSKHGTTRNPWNTRSNASLTSNRISPCNTNILELPPRGSCPPNWKIGLPLDNHPQGHLDATCKNNFRFRLLAGCDGLEADASHCRSRNNHSQPNNSIYKLCHSEPEHNSTSLPNARCSNRFDPASWVTSLQQ